MNQTRRSLFAVAAAAVAAAANPQPMLRVPQPHFPPGQVGDEMRMLHAAEVQDFAVILESARAWWRYAREWVEAEDYPAELRAAYVRAQGVEPMEYQPALLADDYIADLYEQASRAA